MSTPPPPPPAPSYQPVPMSPEDQRLWSVLVHISWIVFGFLPALIGYLALKDRGDFIRGHMATALNFQLTMLIASLVSAILCLILIGFVLLFAISIIMLVFSIMAAVAAGNGRPYVYPLTISFVR